ncbi:MBL fold metallo-hydrolase [Actinomadura madurae]|uniref:MBL fold metallo-hydrolase n=1 Tax=Actinomadura madurae TaxID=1993 RepID=UPI00202746AA|nr:MBL fold metallo-hydrolase [Actinomadura madurae]MCP9951807.1 MBL fold metallo-hydrolase [Actinomadura madurae]MCP9968577.1 MBL fold metallo-hydrolase [Actinomadura madurae]MCP9981050.1 MBL fold metallo-hydrolase [Actinomadura madurae]MCQ0007452.1 MBL fold metallo-hydrolase [Actinomadura madurae]MCQ0017245.1 MBL fold metallo-hydrolase [Actinomadura madurae]
MKTAPELALRQLTMQFVGNATMLLRCGPFTLLTDPNFLHRGQRAYLGFGLTTRRLTEPAVGIGDLPQLDAVVLSHLHGDHWDRVARAKLDRGLPIVTTPHAARRLQGWHRFRHAVGLRTWESHTLVKDGALLRITSMPGRHAPGPVQYMLPPVMGSLLEFGPATGDVQFRLYITGDTLMFDGIEQIARRHRDIHVAVLHLGGTRLPGGLLVTMDAVQGADLIEAIRPATAVPVHYEDYTVMTSPLEDFRRELERRGLSDRAAYVAPGQTHTFTHP